jgi:hypothetical protein
VEVKWIDEFEGGFGWLPREPRMRTSHALVAGGGVWLVDPVDVPGLDDRVRAAGEPRGVVQLLDRHNRDCAELATRYEVPHIRVPATQGTPFTLLQLVSLPVWREAALWWEDAGVLVTGDALGTVAYFVAPGEELGVHPFLRLTPPRQLAGFAPEHVLVGHGRGVHGPDAPAALRRALETSRRRMPAAWLNGARYTVRGLRRR